MNEREGNEKKTKEAKRPSNAETAEGRKSSRSAIVSSSSPSSQQPHAAPSLKKKNRNLPPLPLHPHSRPPQTAHNSHPFLLVFFSRSHLLLPGRLPSATTSPLIAEHHNNPSPPAVHSQQSFPLQPMADPRSPLQPQQQPSAVHTQP